MVIYNILKCRNVVKVLALLFILCFNKSWGQAILQWNTFGNAGTETTEPSVFNDPNLSATNLTQSGITPAGNANRFGGSNWFDAGNTAAGSTLAQAIAGNNYIEFIVTPAAGCSVTPTSFDFIWDKSGTGPQNVALRSSADGFAANLGVVAPTAALGTFNTITITGLTNVGTTIFRLYGYGATATGGTGGFDQGGSTPGIVNVQLNGSTSCGGGCTPPTTTISPTTQTLCAGSVTTLTVTSSATSPSYTWQASANGTSGWATVVNGTPTGASYSGINSSTLAITAGSTYYYRCLVADGGTCTATSGTSTLIVTPSTSITTQPTGVTTTSTGTASYTVVASGSGLTYQWQQSTGGAFSNISNGGSNPTYAGATASVMTISNPPLSMSGYSYQCIVSGSCGTVTTNGTATLTVTVPSASVCPAMTGAFINACQGGCAEGDNEILFFNSGTYSIPVSPANIVVTYGSVSSPTTTYTDGFTTNAGQTANLNALASGSCTSLFVDASVAGTIPANSVFMIVRSTCCFNFDFSSYCSAGTIYILYSTDASWVTGGNFTNGGTAGVLRYFKSDFSAIGAGCVTDYNYEPFLLSGGADGDAISFPPGGGAANAYFNNGCTPPALILPIELLDFYATKNEKKNIVTWKVASENNVSQYIIEKSNDGINFAEMARYNANSIEGTLSVYSCEDENPFEGITYYRLSTLEYNNQINYYKIIDIDTGNEEWNSIVYQANENLILEFKNAVPKNAELQIFDLSGKLIIESVVKENQIKISTQAFEEGIYFLKITTPYRTENFRLIVQK